MQLNAVAHKRVEEQEVNPPPKIPLARSLEPKLMATPGVQATLPVSRQHAIVVGYTASSSRRNDFFGCFAWNSLSSKHSLHFFRPRPAHCTLQPNPSLSHG